MIDPKFLIQQMPLFSRFMNWMNLKKDKVKVKIQAFFLKKIGSIWHIQNNQTMNLVHEFDLKFGIGLEYDQSLIWDKFKILS